MTYKLLSNFHHHPRAEKCHHPKIAILTAAALLLGIFVHEKLLIDYVETDT